MSKLVLLSSVVGVFGALFLGAIASAEEAPVRSEYVDRLEKICEPRGEATARAMEGVRGDIEGRRYRAAAAKFAKARQIFGATVAAISAEPRPGSDAATLARWFRQLKVQERYLNEIVAALRAGEAVKVQHLTAAFIRSGNQANRITLAFGFNHCRFKFSRFS